MATNKGWDGSILIGTNAMAHINQWTINFVQEAIDNTAFGSTTPYDRTYEPGMRAHTVSVEGQLGSTDPAQLALLNGMKSTQAGAAVTLILLTKSTTGSKAGWTGSGVPTAITPAQPRGSVGTFSATFQVSGGLSTYST